MKNSEKIKQTIDQTYRDGLTYDQRVQEHDVIIKSLQLIDVNDHLPIDGQYVFAVLDLSPLGKGIFLGDYFYRQKFGFVALPDDEDGYGFITRWISVSEVDKG
jgi:hypothetical protein